MIILLGEWRNIGKTKVQVLSIYLCYCTDMHRITSENFVYFELKLFVQMRTYKCKLSRSAKRHISITSLF